MVNQEIKITGIKSFLIMLRFVFVLSALYFIKDAFYKWDGFSYYMKFSDFLPDLSLAYILWIFIGVLASVVLWFVVYLSFRLLQSIITVRLEHVMAFFLSMLLIVFVKKTFITDISLSELLGLSRPTLLVLGLTLSAVAFWLGKKHIDAIADKIVNGLNQRITPLVALFSLLIIISLPLSFTGTDNDADEEGNKIMHVDLKESSRPNIIFIIIDTLTARDMQMYGYDRPTTPFISKWSKNALVFNNAYSPSNWTSSSVMSVMTGQRLWTHGIWFMTKRHAVSKYEYNFPEVLRENGYDVYGFVQNRLAHPETLGFKEAFSVLDRYHKFWISSGWWFDTIKNIFADRNIVKEWIFETNPIARAVLSLRPDMDFTLFPSEIVYNSFLEQIALSEKKSGTHRPFFAWLHVFPPHDPYISPKPYMGMFGDEDEFNTEKKQQESNLIEKNYGPERQVEVEILRKRYDEFITYSDNQFKRFVSGLEEAVDMSNTIIILTSDHGESFSHGYQGHGGDHLYEQIINVPLIIKTPAGFASSGRQPEAGFVNMPVELIDIAPTILEFAEIPVPDWMEGRSLKPLIDGGTLEPRPVLSMQFIKNRAFGQLIENGTIAVRDGDYKLIYYLEDKKTLLFNLKKDPDEAQNIFGREPNIALRLKRLVDDNLADANARITKPEEQ